MGKNRSGAFLFLLGIHVLRQTAWMLVNTIRLFTLIARQRFGPHTL